MKDIPGPGDLMDYRNDYEEREDEVAEVVCYTCWKETDEAKLYPTTPEGYICDRCLLEDN